MKFFTQHFNRHHFFHAPHRWFLALLLSPIQAAEHHYKKRYHLRFAHARKLFIFDLTLLSLALGLATMTAAWLWYDPTVTALVSLSLDPAVKDAAGPDRIRSGEYVSYTVRYRNDSDVSLSDPELRVHFPAGFMVESALPSDRYSSSTETFSLPDLTPRSGGEAIIRGRFFGTPDTEEQIIAYLTYAQAGKTWREVKRSPVITTLRGSVLETELTVPDTILELGSSPITLLVRNPYDQALPSILVPFPQADGFTLTAVSSSAGRIEPDAWFLPPLLPGQEERLTLRLDSSLAAAVTELELAFTPQFKLQQHVFSQVKVGRRLKVSHPRLSVNGAWGDGRTKIVPGHTAALAITVENNGDLPLSDLSLSVSMPAALVDTARLSALNLGAYSGGVFTVGARQHPDWGQLNPGEARSLVLQIPIRSVPQGGSDLVLLPAVRASARPAAPGAKTIQAEGLLPGLAVGTVLLLEADARYYTAEGDQLGRGPLPPVVGKQTKYWALIKIANTTSRVQNLAFRAVLPAHIVWTGKSSVSRGSDATYNPSTRAVSWSLPAISAHESVGVYFELGFTPGEEHRGQTPPLLEQISVLGEDSYISNTVSASAAPLNTGLPNDARARQKGVLTE